MAIRVACSCGQKFDAKPELAGKQLACPSCGNALVIPKPPPILVSCSCGGKFHAPPHFAGKAAKCPSCGNTIQVPLSGEGLTPISQSQPAAPASQTEPLDDIFSSPLVEPAASVASGGMSQARMIWAIVFLVVAIIALVNTLLALPLISNSFRHLDALARTTISSTLETSSFRLRICCIPQSPS